MTMGGSTPPGALGLAIETYATSLVKSAVRPDSEWTRSS
jgi:hypothetical protein